MRRLPQIAGFVAAGAVVLLVAIYAFRPGAHGSGESARAATRTPTPYPSIIPLPTSTPAPTPDTRPLVVDVKTGAVEPINSIPPDYFLRALLSDGTLLLEKRPGPGPELVISVDVPRTVVLPVPDGAMPALTADHRYVVWLANNHLQVYDATSGTFGPGPPPPGGWFLGGPEPIQLPDGRLLMPVNTTGNIAGNAPTGSWIIDTTGAVSGTLPYSPNNGAVSPDGLRFASAQPNGLHVLTIASGAERLYRDVQFVRSDLIWSPDGAEILYETEHGGSLSVVDLTTGTVRQIFSPPEQRLVGIRFVGSHEIELHITLPELDRFGFLPGVRYRLRDDGSGFHAVDETADGWETCGPACGLPPPGYERDGLAWWVEGATTKDVPSPVTMHLAYVDRAAGTVRDIYQGPEAVYAVRSPDAKSVALPLPRSDGWMLSLINLADGASRDVAQLPAGRGPLMQWFPDGTSLLVYGFGGA